MGTFVICDQVKYFETWWRSPVRCKQCLYLKYVTGWLNSDFEHLLPMKQDKMKTGYSLETNGTRRVSFVSTEQTAASTWTLLTSSHVAFTAWNLFLSYCFSRILCFGCKCVWSTFWDLSLSYDKRRSLSPSSLCFLLCWTLPFCLNLSRCLFVFMTLKANDSFRWAAESVASTPNHNDSDYSEIAGASPFRKYHQSLQTLKPFRWSSSQSVSLMTYAVCLMHLNIIC